MVILERDIDTDVHFLNNKADHPPPWPQLTNNKPTVTRILYIHSVHDVKNIKLWENMGFTSFRAARLLLSVIWKLTLNILSDGFLSQSKVQHFNSDWTGIHKGAAAALLTYTNSATVSMLFPHMVWQLTQDCFVSVLFLTAQMSHWLWKRKEMAQ